LEVALGTPGRLGALLVVLRHICLLALSLSRPGSQGVRAQQTRQANEIAAEAQLVGAKISVCCGREGWSVVWQTARAELAGRE